MLPRLSHNMFLDPNISKYIEHVRAAHRPCLEFAQKLNELGHRAMFSGEVRQRDAQHVLLATLLQRALTSFQATVILLERGLSQEAKVTLRTLLEVTFKTVAIAKHQEIAEAFILEDETQRRKFIRKYRALSPELQNAKAKAELDSLLDACETKIAENGIQELKTQWFAKKAGLLDFYNTAYAVLSTEVHVNVRTLEGALNIDKDGNLVGLKYGFSDEDLDNHVLTACEALIFSLRASFSKGEIPEATVDEIHSIHDEFNALHKKLNGDC